MPPGWTCAKTVESFVCHAIASWVVTERYATGFPRHIEYVDHELITEHKSQLDNGLEVVDHYTIGGEQWRPAA